MKKIKMAWIFVLAMALALGIWGGTPDAVAKKIIIKCAHNGNAAHPYQKGYEKFKEVLEAETKGAVEVQIFPNAQFIHLFRDGRDVAASMLDKWGARDFHIDIYFTARNWDRRTRQARAAGASLAPGRYYELPYESLVADPKNQLQELCDFLAETYIPAMATPHHLAQTEIEPGSFHDSVRTPPSTTRSGRCIPVAISAR